MPLPGDLLQRDAEEAVRVIALDFLLEARSAAPRILDSDDAEGLHDFRVAIRRLRSTLSAWKGLLGGRVGKPDRRSLAGFQRRTGGGRDAEVALEWLAGQTERLDPRHRPGFEWVERRLRAMLLAPAGDPKRTVCDEFLRWADEFRSRMTRRTPGRRVGHSYSAALRERVDGAAQRLRVLVSGIGEDRGLGPHKVRIAGKRLRYLVEPIRAESEAARFLVHRCKQLQDTLGDLNDANVLADLLADPGRSAPGDEIDLAGVPGRGEGAAAGGAALAVRSGVLELRRLNAARAEACYETFSRDWRSGGGMEALLGEAAALARQLRRLP